MATFCRRQASCFDPRPCARDDVLFLTLSFPSRNWLLRAKQVAEAMEAKTRTLYEPKISTHIDDICAARTGRDFEVRLWFAHAMLNGIADL
jgi:hypothetical protein